MILALANVSCNGFLDRDPDGSVPEWKALQNLADCDAFVVGVYSAFKTSSLYSGYFTLLPDIQADMAYSAQNTNTGFYTSFYQWNIKSSSTEVQDVYNGLYNVVARCNFFLDYKTQVEKNLETESDKKNFDKRLGEVYFARALAFSELIRTYCEAYNSENADKENMGISLPDTYKDDVPLVKRSTLRQSYEQVLSDLKNAERLIPASRTAADSPYFSQGAVFALRARVCMYMGMGDLKVDKNNQHLKDAVEAATKVIKTGVYALADATTKAYQDGAVQYSEYQWMWLYDSSDEIIWKIAMTTNSYGGSLGGDLIGNRDNVTYNPQYLFPEAILDLYDNNDFRVSAFCAQQEDSHGDPVYLIIKYPGNPEIDGGATKKFVNMPKPLRLSEVYLIRAEAYYWLDEEEKAQEDLATLKRKRIRGFGSVSASGEDLLKEIQDERARELYLEGFRLSDLKRWHLNVERKKQLYTMDGPNNNLLKVTYGSDKYRFMTWPIPNHEISASNGLIVGNASNN